MADCCAFRSALVGGLVGSLPNLSSTTPDFGFAGGVPGGVGLETTSAVSGAVGFAGPAMGTCPSANPLVARLPG
jgi:hypothetical protein